MLNRIIYQMDPHTARQEEAVIPLLNRRLNLPTTTRGESLSISHNGIIRNEMRNEGTPVLDAHIMARRPVAGVRVLAPEGVGADVDGVGVAVGAAGGSGRGSVVGAGLLRQRGRDGILRAVLRWPGMGLRRCGELTFGFHVWRRWLIGAGGWVVEAVHDAGS